MALGSTQPLTKMRIRNTCISWKVKRPVRRADNVTTFMSGSLDLLEPSGPVQAISVHRLLLALSKGGAISGFDSCLSTSCQIPEQS